MFKIINSTRSQIFLFVVHPSSGDVTRTYKLLYEDNKTQSTIHEEIISSSERDSMIYETRNKLSEHNSFAHTESISSPKSDSNTHEKIRSSTKRKSQTLKQIDFRKNQSLLNQIDILLKKIINNRIIVVLATVSILLKSRQLYLFNIIYIKLISYLLSVKPNPDSHNQ